jgi:hypothetical protein
MFIHHTISEDRSGTDAEVTSKLLAALGAREERTPFSDEKSKKHFGN